MNNNYHKQMSKIINPDQVIIHLRTIQNISLLNGGSSMYYIGYLCRRKYNEKSKQSHKIIHEDLINLDKTDDELLVQINNILLYKYLDKSDEGCVLYITDNSLNVESGINDYMQQWLNIQLMRLKSTEDSQYQKIIKNPLKLYMHYIHKSHYKIIYQIDIDTIDPNDLSKVVELIDKVEVYFIVKTQGGFHILIGKPNHDVNIKLHNLTKVMKMSIHNNNMTSICGSTQNGYEVHAITLDEFKKISIS